MEDAAALQFESMGPRLGEMIDRGFAVANTGSYTVLTSFSIQLHLGPICHM